MALKMLLNGEYSGPLEIQRFRGEIEAVAALQHPHIVAIHEVGEHEGRPFFSMEYVDGPNLHELESTRPLEVKRAAPPRPRLLNPGLPRDLETICLQCLEKGPHARYPSAEALAADLERFPAGKTHCRAPAGLAGQSGAVVLA